MLKINQLFMNLLSKIVLAVVFVLLSVPMEAKSYVNKIDTLGIIFKYDKKKRTAAVDSAYNIGLDVKIPQYVVGDKGKKYEVESLGYMSFSRMQIEHLTLSLPGSISSIGFGSFYTSNIKSITINGFLSDIHDRAFHDSRSLERLDIQPVESVGNLAFMGCESLKEITFLSRVKKIGDLAFYGCESIELLDMPDCLSELGKCAFAYCSNLKSVRFSRSLSILKGRTFYNCTSLTEIDLPDNIKRVCKNAFEGCKKLTKVRASKNTVIEEKAFPSNVEIEYY